MTETYLYTLISVLIVSAMSLVGVVALGIKENFLKQILQYLVGFSAGALLGDVFIHVIPEMSESGFGPRLGVYFLVGIVVFFLLEKYILWHHSHDEHQESVHSLVWTSLVGDSLHNFIDGMVIAASFMASVPLGIAATVAVVLHEIPQEIGQFGLLVHGGWSKGRALLYNFISGLTSILGALIVLIFAKDIETPQVLLAFAGASFIYIAMSDIIPELHKERSPVKSFWQIIAFVIGVAVMASLLYLE